MFGDEVSFSSKLLSLRQSFLIAPLAHFALLIYFACLKSDLLLQTHSHSANCAHVQRHSFLEMIILISVCIQLPTSLNSSRENSPLGDPLMFKGLSLKNLKIQSPALYPAKVEKPNLISFSSLTTSAGCEF